MAKTQPERSPAIVRISDPAMEGHEVDLNALLDKLTSDFKH